MDEATRQKQDERVALLEKVQRVKTEVARSSSARRTSSTR